MSAETAPSQAASAAAYPDIAAKRGYIDAVIQPSDTRRQLALVLRALCSKRATLPSEKHGNIPL